MSRHEIIAHNPKACDAAAGWDAPYQTFFYQETETIWLGDEEVDKTVILIGINSQEHMDVDKFIDRLTRFADVPPGFRDQLLDDRDGEGSAHD